MIHPEVEGRDPAALHLLAHAVGEVVAAADPAIAPLHAREALLMATTGLTWPQLGLLVERARPHLRLDGPLASLHDDELLLSGAHLALIRRVCADVLDPAAHLRELWRGRAAASGDARWLALAARLDAAAQSIRNTLSGLRELPVFVRDGVAAQESVWRLVAATQVRVSPPVDGAQPIGQALHDATLACSLLGGLAAAAAQDTDGRIRHEIGAVTTQLAGAVAASQAAAWLAGGDGAVAYVWAAWQAVGHAAHALRLLIAETEA